MESKLQKLGDCKVELSISLTKEDLAKYKIEAIKELGKDLGKISDKEIEEKVGKEKVASETTNQAINKSLIETVEKEQIFIISRPEVRIRSMEPLEFTATFEVRPSIDLGKYEDIKVEKKEIEVSDKEIEEQVEFFRLEVSENKKVERAAKKGDIVNIDFEGFDSDGKTVPNTKSAGFSMDIGSGKMIPGFEEEATGMKAGEEKDFDITFPKEYHSKDMAGKKYKFHFKINEVQEKVLAEVDEKLVEKITGTKKSVEDFKKEIKSHLIVKKESEEMRRLEDELLEKWCDSIQCDIPNSETEKEIEMMIDSIKFQGLQGGTPWEEYQKKIGKTEGELKIEMGKNASGNVKKRYIIQEIIKKEGIKVEDSEVEAELGRYEIEALSRGQKFDRTKYEKGSKDYMTIINQLLIGKVFSKYLPVSKCSDASCTHDHS